MSLSLWFLDLKVIQESLVSINNLIWTSCTYYSYFIQQKHVYLHLLAENLWAMSLSSVSALMEICPLRIWNVYMWLCEIVSDSLHSVSSSIKSDVKSPSVSVPVRRSLAQKSLLTLTAHMSLYHAAGDTWTWWDVYTDWGFKGQIKASQRFVLCYRRTAVRNSAGCRVQYTPRSLCLLTETHTSVLKQYINWLISRATENDSLCW